MDKAIVRYDLAVNGNPWWIALHNSGVTHEVQINFRTGNILIGMGMLHTVNSQMPVEDLVTDATLQKTIESNFNSETLEHILKVCHQTLVGKTE